MTLYYSDGIGGWTALGDQYLRCSNGATWECTYGSKLYRSNGASWDKIWEWWTPSPPAGVIPELLQEFFSGGDVDANWVNTTNDYAIEVAWELNGNPWGSTFAAAGEQTTALGEAELTDSDVVRARMRYYYLGVVGAWSDWSDPLYYIG